jgi:hypothetical protein
LKTSSEAPIPVASAIIDSVKLSMKFANASDSRSLLRPPTEAAKLSARDWTPTVVVTRVAHE